MVGRSPPKLASVKSEAAGGGGLKGQTLQERVGEETMSMRWACRFANHASEVVTSATGRCPCRIIELRPNSDHRSTVTTRRHENHITPQN